MMFYNILWHSFILCFHNVPEGSATFCTVPGKSTAVLVTLGQLTVAQAAPEVDLIQNVL